MLYTLYDLYINIKPRHSTKQMVSPMVPTRWRLSKHVIILLNDYTIHQICKFTLRFTALNVLQ